MIHCSHPSRGIDLTAGNCTASKVPLPQSLVCNDESRHDLARDDPLNRVSCVRVGLSRPDRRHLVPLLHIDGPRDRATDYDEKGEGDPKTAYKDATLVVNYSTASTGVPINTNKFDVAKTEVRVKDLILQSSKSYLTLNGATVRVIDRTHKDGEGWGGTMETLVKGDGKVVWGVPGFLLFVR